MLFANETTWDLLNYSSILTPLIEVFILIFLMLIMVYLYKNMRVVALMMICLMFSVIIGVISITNWSLPFTPYLQVFFILFQLILVIVRTSEALERMR
ncbi:MAG: hypothetical protein ACQERX_05230 [Bacillota bacterium]